MDVFVQTHKLVVFERDELLQLGYFLLGLLLLLLVLLQHGDQRVEGLVARVPQVLDDLLGHLHFFLVFFELEGQLLRVSNESPDVLHLLLFACGEALQVLPHHGFLGEVEAELLGCFEGEDALSLGHSLVRLDK